jgi:hypothetical protein
VTFDTFTITGKGQPILIVEAGQGPTLIVHNDTDTGFVILSDDTSSVGNNPNQGFPLPSSGFLNVDGKNNVYAIGAAASDSHTVNVVPGGLSFFQPSDTLIVAGPTSGILVYNPNQGADNLIASLVSNIIVDKFGNVIKPEGLTVYGADDTRIFVGIGASGSTEELFFSGLAQELQSFGIVSGTLLSGGAEFIAGALEGPQINLAGHEDWVLLQLNSPNVGGTSSANGALSYVDTNGNETNDAHWDSTGFNIDKGPGNVQADVTQRNATTSALTQITPSYTIPANLMAPGNSWELELFIAGNQNVTTATTLTFTFEVNGNNTAITIPAGFCTANGAFRGSVKLKVACKIAGPANVAAIFINGEVHITQTTFAIANSNSWEVSSPNAQGPNANVDTTVAQAVAISATWGTSGSLGGLYSRFLRKS